mgnify:CR=1 FL=1
MFTQGFTVSGSSLKLLKVGERGKVTHLRPNNDRVAQKLRSHGIHPGMSIVVEQRSPRFIIRVGRHRLALDDQTINSIYVRLLSERSGYPQSAPGLETSYQTSPSIAHS